MNSLPSDKNFLGIEDPAHYLYANSRFIIQPVPYEHTSSYHGGSAKGPEAIIQASQYVEYYDEELQCEPFRKVGIATIDPIDFNDSVDSDAMDLIASNTGKIINDGKFVFSLGAEHTVTFGLVKAHQSRYKNLSVLQIDAHSDLRNSYQGNKWSHASVMARVNELDLKISQVGIRAQCREEAELINASTNINTVYSYQLRNDQSWQKEAIDHLSENVYITIDADGFDPSVIPHVGTPEPDGLLWNETLELLKNVIKTKNVVGVDIVEVAPVDDYTLSEYTLAKLAYKIIGFIVQKEEI